MVEDDEATEWQTHDPDNLIGLFRATAESESSRADYPRICLRVDGASLDRSPTR